MSLNDKTLVLFDGVCNLCERSVIFLIKHDKHDRLRFASIQSVYGGRVLDAQGIPEEDRLSSFFVVEDGVIYSKSQGWRHLLRHLSFPANLLRYLFWLPEALADRVYAFIGGRRYQWFGKKDHCMVPEKDWTYKFIEDEEN